MQARFLRDILYQAAVDQGHYEDQAKLELKRLHFEQLLQEPSVTRALETTGVDVVELVDLLDVIFVKEPVPFADLIQGILQLRSCNTTTVKDLVGMRRFITHEYR